MFRLERGQGREIFHSLYIQDNANVFTFIALTSALVVKEVRRVLRKIVNIGSIDLVKSEAIHKTPSLKQKQVYTCFVRSHSEQRNAPF